MELKMSANKVENKPKPVLLFHISQSLFKNKRLKRRLMANKTQKKSPLPPQKKISRPKPKPRTKKETINGHPSPDLAALFSETIEIVSTDDEQQEEKEPPPKENEKPPEVETSILLSSDDEDESTTQARIFPMLTNQTTVQTEVGNSVFELSLTQLKENLQTITKKRKKHRDSKRLSKRLTNSSKLSADLSISLLSDDDDADGEGGGKKEDNKLDKQPSGMMA